MNDTYTADANTTTTPTADLAKRPAPGQRQGGWPTCSGTPRSRSPATSMGTRRTARRVLQSTGGAGCSDCETRCCRSSRVKFLNPMLGLPFGSGNTAVRSVEVKPLDTLTDQGAVPAKQIDSHNLPGTGPDRTGRQLVSTLSGRGHVNPVGMQQSPAGRFDLAEQVGTDFLVRQGARWARGRRRSDRSSHLRMRELKLKKLIAALKGDSSLPDG
jgi:hypothetical protein